MPTETVENYVKSIYKLQQADDHSTAALGKLATRLAITPGTATTMAKNLAQAGYVHYIARKGVTLTPKGQKLALHVIRRHRLVELLLVQIVGCDWSRVHDEAEILEHAISDYLLEKIDQLLGYPTTDPHGDPIPQASGKIKRQKVQKLSQAKPAHAIIARVTDHEPQFLTYLRQQQLTPGAKITIQHRDPLAGVITLTLKNSKTKIHLSLKAAENIYIYA